MDKNGLKESLLEYIKTILITVVVTFSILYFVQISKVVGESMEPTYHDGNIVLVDKVFYKQGNPKVNDVIVAECDVFGTEEQIIKRVIGVAGDTIEMKDNQLYRNGEKLEEDYINETMFGNMDFKYVVPDGKIFIMGDNRNNSTDSRILGFIDFDEQVVGKVFFKVF